MKENKKMLKIKSIFVFQGNSCLAHLAQLKVYNRPGIKITELKFIANNPKIIVSGGIGIIFM